MNASTVRSYLITGASLTLAGVLIGAGLMGWFDPPPPPQGVPEPMLQPATLTGVGTTATRSGMGSEPSSYDRADVRTVAVRPSTSNFAAFSPTAGGLAPAQPLEALATRPMLPIDAGGGQTVVNAVNPPSGGFQSQANLVILNQPLTGSLDGAVAVALSGIERFTRMGFDVEAVTFSGSLGVGEVATISRQLVGGNVYWFCVATVTRGSEASVSVYEMPNGAVKDGGGYQQDAPGSGGTMRFFVVFPAFTGEYELRVRMEKALDGQQAGWGLAYAFK